MLFRSNLCGGDPACASACPTNAIVWLEDFTRDWQGPFAAERSAAGLAAFAVAGAGPRP